MTTAQYAAMFLAAVALAAGCEATPPKEAAGRNVVRPAFGLAIDVPQGWTWRDLAGDVVMEIYRPVAPQEAGASGEAAAGQSPRKPRRAIVHVVVVDREGLSLDAWADQAIKDSQELQSDLEVVGREKSRLADGREALRLTLKNPRGLEPLVQRMLLAMTEKRAYAVVATASESDLADAETAFARCFDSFVVW